MNILVITEQRDARWNPVSFETLAAAQQISGQTQSRLAAVVIGKGVRPLADELAGFALAEVCSSNTGCSRNTRRTDSPSRWRRRSPAPSLIWCCCRTRTRCAISHRSLPASLGRGMIGDCIGYRAEAAAKEAGGLVFVRQMFQGKTAADVTFLGPAPWFASFQAGAFRADQIARGSAPAPVTALPVQLAAEQIRTKPLELFREAKQAVDLTQAPVIVSVGRGIKAPENIPQAEKLAQLLGGQLAASRSICDEGWLPMDRQVGSSGQTVAPKLYLALGISGAIQHVVGMKGARTIVAINKDPNAPIFEVADYGIVGDIFELMPALTSELEKK